MRCLFGTLGVPWLITTTSPKRNWQRLNFFPAGKPNWFTFEIGTSLPRWRSGFSGSSCSVNSSGKLPSIWGWSHHMLWGNLSRDALFTNCPFLQIAFLRCLFACCLFALCLFAWCLFACWLFPWCLFALCLFACCLFALCLFVCCLLVWCLFLRDTYMIVAFLVFLPFSVVFFLPTLTRYISDLTWPFSLLGYWILS